MTHDELKQEVHMWSQKIKVNPLEVHVRQMKRKWASCSSRGRITFNTDILKQTKKFINEVIVHELLHLKYPNHGKMFKALMKSYCRGPAEIPTWDQKNSPVRTKLIPHLGPE
jgi:predicted metal-dependent hydrolase